MTKLTKFFAIALVATMTIAGCKKVEELQESITSAEDQAISESVVSSTYDVIDDVGATSQFGKTGSTILPSGATLTFTDTTLSDSDGYEYVIDFGPLGTTTPKGLLCLDGRYRAGKLIITQSKKFDEIGCVINCTIADADEYHVGDGSEMVKFTGGIKVTRTGANSVGIEITNGKAVTSKGTIESHSNKSITRTQDNGPGTLGDEFEISGTGGGKNRDGESFNWNITTPLVKKVSAGCATTFVKGVIELSNSKGSKLTFNFDPYNNGACDKTVEVTLPNGTKKTFTVN